MEDFVRIIRASNGDIFHVTLSCDSIPLGEETACLLSDVKMVGIDLKRLKGVTQAGQDILAAIENVIADFFLQHEDVIIIYFCDFLNPIPYSRKTEISAQKYRSDLFRLMFKRYMQHHQHSGIHLSVVTVEGTDESFYIHLIYRQKHASLIPIISQDIVEGYGK